MITYVYGDLFYSPARVLVNPVNTTGTMGKGPGNDFKRFYPDMYEQYRALCQADQFDIGQLLLYKTPHKWVLNFPTKKHYRANARQEYIESGLQKFAAIYADQNLTSVSFPALGTGEDNLDWDETVRPLMEGYLGALPISIFIHIDDDDDPFQPERRNVRALRRWLEHLPAAVNFEMFWRALVRVVNERRDFHTLDGAETRFRVTVADRRKNGGRISLKILIPGGGQPIFISENVLRDLWQYITRAGYALPRNLPAGLDAHAPYLVALLGHLPMLRPVYLAAQDGERVVGLHMIPPAQGDDDAHTVALADPEQEH